MGLYDNAWSHVYEEIRRFYPVWYRDVLEMDAIWRAQGVELDGVRSAIDRIVFNGYIHTADAETIAKYEEFLEIAPESGATLEARRAQIAAIMFPSPHIGAPEIRDIVGIFTSGKVDVAFSKGLIRITVSGTADKVFALRSCGLVLQKRIPAHLALCMVGVISAQAPTILHIGGSAGTVVRLGLPPGEDTYNFRRTLPTGGRGGMQSFLGIQEDTAPPPGTTILRTGGVCTILSNLSKGE